MLRSTRFRLLFVPVLLIIGSGCGSGRLPTYPVAGKVQYRNGKPVRGGVIEFRSENPAAEGLNARGQIADDGSFRLSTYGKDDGAIEGQHRAIVVPAISEAMKKDDEKRPPPRLIAARYQSFERSGLQFTVQPGSNQPLTITVDDR